MKDRQYDNADSFAISFDEEWKKLIEDLRLKIEKYLTFIRSSFLLSNQKMREDWLI